MISPNSKTSKRKQPLIVFERGQGFLQLTKISRLHDRPCEIEHLYTKGKELNEDFGKTEHGIDIKILAKTLSTIKPKSFNLQSLTARDPNVGPS